MAPTSPRVKNATPPTPQINGNEAEPGSEGNIEIVEPGNTGAGEDVNTTDGQQQGGDPGIEELRAQLAEEKRRREAVEQENARLANARQADQKEITDTRLLVITTKIAEQEQTKKAILTKIKDAMEAGDYDATVAAQDELSMVNIDLKQSKLGKSRLEQDIEDGTDAARRNPPANQDDQLEQFITDQKIDPRSARWLRNHADYVFDKAKNAQLVRAHSYAMGHDGVQGGSDEYFRIIEERLGLRETTAEVDDHQQQEEQPQRRAGNPPAAPVSRAGGGGLGGGGKQIMDGIVELSPGRYRVSPEVKAFAESIGMSVKDYVENAKALKKGPDGHFNLN